VHIAKNQGKFEEGGLAWWMRALWLAKKTCPCSHIASIIYAAKIHLVQSPWLEELPTEGMHRQVILG